MTYYDDLGKLSQKNNTIENQAYDLYNVKRGLRNPDGSGVLVGLTTISTVLGYEKIDEEITPMDGKLCYRGITTDKLVRAYENEQRFGFEEVVFLLLFGQLPKEKQLIRFIKLLTRQRHLPLNFPRDVLQTFRTPDITNALARSVLTLYGSEDNPDDLSVGNQVRQAVDLIAKMSTLVPYAYYSIMHAFFNKSLIIHKPDDTLSTAEHFLHLLRADGKYTDLEAKALDILLILHADHGGGNNSTFTTRVVSSTNTDLYSAIAASLGSLKGPLHGGANVRALKMMADLKANVRKRSLKKDVIDYLNRVLKGELFDQAGKIYGIGHAVYTISDPRTIILKEYARKLAEEKGRLADFALYEFVEQTAPGVLRDFKKNPDLMVCANVDFYSGFIFDCLNVPIEVYTPVFAIARIAGWCAHRIEVITNQNKIMRPAYKALKRQKNYAKIADRR